MAVLKNTWILYKNSKVEAGKNFKFDNLADFQSYFNSISNSNKLVIEDGQFIKHDLEITLKINADQNLLNYYNSNNNINYVTIQNTDDTHPVGYFVMGKKWTAEKTLTLNLYQDTINSQIGNYVIGAKTSIKREHRDRFKKINDNTIIVRNIDKIPEGLTPTLFKDNSKDAYIQLNEDLKNTNFYLVYFKGQAAQQNENDTPQEVTMPVKILLLSDNENLYWQDGPTTYQDMIITGQEIGLYYSGTKQLFVKAEENLTVLPWDGGHVSDYGASAYIDAEGKKHVVKFIEVAGAGMTLCEVIYNANGTYNRTDTMARGVGQFKITKFDDSSTPPRYFDLYEYNNASMPDYYMNLENSTLKRRWVATPSNPAYRCNTIYDLDRTNAALLKIIQLPYPPLIFEYENGRVIYGDEWRRSTWPAILTEGTHYGLLLENNWSKNFRCFIDANVDPLEPLKYAPQNPSASDLRDENDINESKLFNSDYYNAKYVYDTFAFNFMLERVDVEAYYNEPNFNIEFAASTQMADSFLFKYNSYKLGDAGCFDYDGVMVVQRNNQISIYSDAYLNYIRGAYRYDLQRKEQQDYINIGGLILTAGAGIAALIATAASGGSLALPATALFTGIASGAMNTINTSYQNDAAIEQKLKQYKQQSMTEEGASDVIIMNEYTNNKLKYVQYGLSQQSKKATADLFYYFGYAANYTGIPKETGRYWFNFVQAELQLDDTKNINDRIVEDIKNKYKEGITVLHKHNNTWDFAQVKENWEIWLLN